MTKKGGLGPPFGCLLTPLVCQAFGFERFRINVSVEHLSMPTGSSFASIL
jgi:hypothetical protein